LDENLSTVVNKTLIGLSGFVIAILVQSAADHYFDVKKRNVEGNPKGIFINWNGPFCETETWFAGAIDMYVRKPFVPDRHYIATEDFLNAYIGDEWIESDVPQRYAKDYEKRLKAAQKLADAFQQTSMLCQHNKITQVSLNAHI